MYELTDRALPLELDTFTGSCTHLPLILNFLSAISKKKKHLRVGIQNATLPGISLDIYAT